jgi:hypothetical protein
VLPSRTHTEARFLRRQALARLITAEKMGLLDDALGENLNLDLWTKSIDQANAVVTLIKREPNDV